MDEVTPLSTEVRVGDCILISEVSGRIFFLPEVGRLHGNS